MSKTLESPYPEYPGKVTFPDALTFPQLLAFDNALFATRGIATIAGCQASIDAVNSIVEWHIDNLPEKPTPESIFIGHPVMEAKALYTWVLIECIRVYRAEREIPKA